MKAKHLLYLCPFICMHLSAQVAGPDNPNSFSNALIPGYSQSWINISNVGLDDEIYASFGNIPGTAGSHTDYLLTNNYGFTLPAGTIINGIKVEMKCSDPNSRTSDYSVRIVKTGAIAGVEKAAGTPYPSSDGYITYGGPTDLWGETWDYKFIDDNKFGVAIAAQRNNSDDVVTGGQVDHIRITVYYTFTTLPVTLTSFTASMQNKNVQVNWKTTSEDNINNYNVERSADGRNFNQITSVQALNAAVANYSYVDNNPLSGVSYYRLNIQGMAGYQKYSQIVSVKSSQANLAWLYPNIWQKGEDLNITNNTNEKLTVYFFGISGQVLSTVTTGTKLVPNQTLSNRNGMIYYKILDDKKNILGTGHLLIL
ncbi:MAG TPA: hypothetical protein VK483_15225 [Chitinophagaceae bacterium]|nr:hypothetical protein [Chitinophagaceae bacterium]